MPEVTVVCDRCKNDIEGYEYPEATSGFYRRTPNPPENVWEWGRFMNPDENTLCDACMYKEPRYIAVYGARK